MSRSAAPPEPAPTTVPQPARPNPGTLPHALTFFLTVAQRRRILAALRRLHPRREHALLLALDLAPPPTPAP